MPITHAVILAGGVGSRFWPLSQPEKPKQFLQLFSEKSLLLETVERAQGVFDSFSICTHFRYQELTQREAPQIPLILEPLAKNTAPALFYSLYALRDLPPEAVLAFFPADHYIDPPSAFQRDLKFAISSAFENRKIVLIGIKPTGPSESYGYIQVGRGEQDLFPVEQFHEKPTREVAKNYLNQGSFFWNSGIFIGRKDVFMSAFQDFLPHYRLTNDSEISSFYQQVVPISFDVGILHHLKKLVAIQASFRWSDVGTWDSLFQLKRETSPTSCLVLSGNVQFENSENCIVSIDPKTELRVKGIQNCAIVQSGEKVLVAALDCPTEDEKR